MLPSGSDLVVHLHLLGNVSTSQAVRLLAERDQLERPLPPRYLPPRIEYEPQLDLTFRTIAVQEFIDMVNKPTNALPAGASIPGAVFISYRRAGVPHFAGRLQARFACEFGPDRTFLDVGGIATSQNSQKVVEDTLKDCTAFVAVIGPNWLVESKAPGADDLWSRSPDYVRIEIGAAISLELPIFPVLVDDAEMPEPNQLPPDIAAFAGKHAISFAHDSFERDFERLLDDLVDATLT